MSRAAKRFSRRYAELMARGSDYAIYLTLASLLNLVRLLPYATRVGVFGWIVKWLIAPLTDMRRRVFANLDYVFPNTTYKEKTRIYRECVDNFGRLIIEILSEDQFSERYPRFEHEGPGLKAIEQARMEGRAVLVVSGHFGNFDTGRISLILRGYSVGAVYRRFNNRYFNSFYEKSVRKVGEPIFVKGIGGTSGLVRFIRQGGIAALLCDQHASGGADLEFMGKPAKTVLSAAHLALRYNALLVPFYGVRKANGLDFRCVFEAPIEHGDPSEMTQQLNDSLEGQVRANPGQWFWIHNRWKI